MLAARNDDDGIALFFLEIQREEEMWTRREGGRGREGDPL